MTLIIFDLDGTLLDTLRDIADSANRALAELHLPTHPVNQYRYMVGDGNRNLMKRALPDDRQDLLDQALARQIALYRVHMFDHTRPYDGIEPMLTTLRDQGHQLAVLSNKPHLLTQQVIARYFAPDLFAAVQGHLPPTPLKPDPASALQLAAQLSVNPQLTAYVGDTSTDMQTGRNANMHTIGCTWGFRDREELLAHGAHHTIDHPADLPALLNHC